MNKRKNEKVIRISLLLDSPDYVVLEGIIALYRDINANGSSAFTARQPGGQAAQIFVMFNNPQQMPDYLLHIQQIQNAARLPVEFKMIRSAAEIEGTSFTSLVLLVCFAATPRIHLDSVRIRELKSKNCEIILVAIRIGESAQPIAKQDILSQNVGVNEVVEVAFVSNPPLMSQLEATQSSIQTIVDHAIRMFPGLGENVILKKFQALFPGLPLD
eukprot:c6905_g1_i2.p1 GENE.c6905_g1_i2~~c6905_g1_i2.p1  ORF type:complete len:215 (+),score=79.68 c6905_g1_i2:461-1105(+)